MFDVHGGWPAAWHRILLAGVCGFSIDASSMTPDQKAAFGLQLSESVGPTNSQNYKFAVQLGNVLSTTHAQAKLFLLDFTIVAESTICLHFARGTGSSSPSQSAAHPEGLMPDGPVGPAGLIAATGHFPTGAITCVFGFWSMT